MPANLKLSVNRMSNAFCLDRTVPVRLGFEEWQGLVQAREGWDRRRPRGGVGSTRLEWGVWGGEAGFVGQIPFFCVREHRGFLN